MSNRCWWCLWRSRWSWWYHWTLSQRHNFVPYKYLVFSGSFVFTGLAGTSTTFWRWWRWCRWILLVVLAQTGFSELQPLWWWLLPTCWAAAGVGSVVYQELQLPLLSWWRWCHWLFEVLVVLILWVDTNCFNDWFNRAVGGVGALGSSGFSPDS